MTEGANPCLRKSLRNLVVIPGKPAIAGATRNPEGTGGLDSRAPGSYESCRRLTNGFQFWDPGTKTKKTRRSYETLDDFTSPLDLSDAE